MNKIESKEQLIEFIRSGEKKPNQFKIGTEHEKFAFDILNKKPIPYEGKNGIKELLSSLEEFGWQPIKEADNVIALSRPNSLGGGSITLEPAGQFELSGAMLNDIHETLKEIQEHKDQLYKVAKKMDLSFLAIGFTPDWSREDMHLMPKKRYEIMRKYMPKKGDHGLDMMLRSCTTQVNLDYSSESDMIKKIRLSFLLQPIATVLFSNSPISDNKINGFKSIRSHSWTDTDPDRTGILPFIFKEDMSYESYVDYALNVPMYFIYREGKYIDLAGSSFIDFMDGKLESAENQVATIEDWELHLTTIFPEVRLKTFLEMRGADAGNIDHVCALSAFWVGLLYDNISLENALNLVNDISFESLLELRNLTPIEGFDCRVGSHNVFEIAKEAVRISSEGLKRRGKIDSNGNDEQIFLTPLNEIIQNKESPADRLLRKYNNEWNKDIMKIYENCLF
ncbi:MAG: glutamate--cysteine ligase [Pseudomonadota bacterium]|nr:glutamate--cysteine ligase [Pseudomonadota bacterium]